MKTEEFIEKYLPDPWAERDLQLWLQRRFRAFGLFSAPDEVRLKTPTTTRRIDISTWSTHYEVKKFLTRDNIFHAVAQTELYRHYGPKLLGVVPKRRAVIGLTPIDPIEIEPALKLAEDFRQMGIQIVFVNEADFSYRLQVSRLGAIAFKFWWVLAAIALGVAIWGTIVLLMNR